MADKKQPINSIFHRLGSDKSGEFPHLRPLSVYSRMITCDTPNDVLGEPSWIPKSPFCNIKIEIVNSSVSVSRKRQLDDSCLDETYETPQKKRCLPTCHSPDLACVLDSSLPGEKAVFPECCVLAEKVHKLEDGSNNKENTSKPQVPPLHKSTCLVLTDSSDESDGQSSPSLSFSDIQSSSPLILHSEDLGDQCPAFDFDVDEIMCLSPIDCKEEQPDSDGQEGFFQSCQTFYEEPQACPLNEACRGHSSCHKNQSSEQVSGKVKGEEDGKNTGTENDEGYFTKSFKTSELKEAKNLTPSQNATPVMSTPLDKFRQLVKRSPVLKRLGKLGQCLPALNQDPVKASSPISLHGSMNLDDMNTEVGPEIPLLDGNENRENKFSSVGTAIQKSIVCYSAEQAPVVADTVKQVKESKDVPSVSQQVNPKFKVTFREEKRHSKNLESAAPLEEKSKVVSFSIQRPGVKAKSTVRAATAASASTSVSATQQPETKPHTGNQTKVPREVQRPVVFHREKDWETEKTMYVDSVIRHMKDNTGAGDGVMTELLHLMDTVANRGSRSDGKQWQHPSDLTSRNYQPRNRGHLLSLDEWRNLSYPNHRRFAKVPHPFRRSLVP